VAHTLDRGSQAPPRHSPVRRDGGRATCRDRPPRGPAVSRNVPALPRVVPDGAPATVRRDAGREPAPCSPALARESQQALACWLSRVLPPWGGSLNRASPVT